MSPVTAPPPLTTEEIERLMIRLAARCAGAGLDGFTCEEAAALVAWARQARRSARMLERLLAEDGQTR